MSCQTLLLGGGGGGGGERGGGGGGGDGATLHLVHRLRLQRSMICSRGL